MEQKKKVFVGMSGGVDSAVSAYLLKKEGYDVTGVFIKTWQPPFMDCNSKQERIDAMRVAAILDIPFLTLDLEKEYKKYVVDYMVNEYIDGHTPNPDVMCNKFIKFGYFLQYALKNGADFIATGHYAKNIKSKNGIMMLAEPKDTNKDQRYFLWTLTQKELKYILFPVGDLKKTEVRDIAKTAGLMNWQKADSQGVCFLGKINMKDFLTHFIKEKRGDILNTRGEIIGQHKGAFFYTIGQRHGFELFDKFQSKGPYYISNKIFEENILVATPSSEALEPYKELTDYEISWIGDPPDDNTIVTIQTRYRGPKTKANITKNNGNWKMILEENGEFIAGGQSLVIYSNKYCIGGAIIK